MTTGMFLVKYVGCWHAGYAILHINSRVRSFGTLELLQCTYAPVFDVRSLVAVGLFSMPTRGLILDSL